LDGNGVIDATDRSILVANYGFHAVPVILQQGFQSVAAGTSPATPPQRPGFDLEAGSDTAPRGDKRTTLGVVTLVGQTDPNVTVILHPTGAPPQSDCMGLFAFLALPLQQGENLFTVVATGPTGLTNQFPRNIIRRDASTDPDPPVVSAALAQ